jgi:hypothetical protein
MHGSLDDDVADYYKETHRVEMNKEEEKDVEKIGEEYENQKLNHGSVSQAQAEQQLGEKYPSLGTDGNEGSTYWRDWVCRLLEKDIDNVSEDVVIQDVLTGLQNMLYRERPTAPQLPAWIKVAGKGFTRPTDSYMAKNRSKVEIPTALPRRPSGSYSPFPSRSLLREPAAQGSEETLVGRASFTQKLASSNSRARLKSKKIDGELLDGESPPLSGKSQRSQTIQHEAGGASTPSFGHEELEQTVLTEEHKMKMEELERENEKKLDELGMEYEKRLEELEKELAEVLDAEIEAREAELNAQEAEFAAIAEVQKQKRKNKELASKTEESNKTWKRREKELLDGLVKERSTKRKVEIELEKMGQEIAESSFLEEEIRVLEEISRDQEHVIHNLEDELEKMEQEIAECSVLKEKIRAHEEEIRSYKEISRGQERLIHNLEDELSKAMGANNTLKAQVDNMKGQVDKADQVNHELRISLLQAEYAGKEHYEKWIPLFEAENKKYMKLQAAHDELKDKAGKLYEEWCDLRSRNEELTQKLNRCQKHGIRLAKEVAHYKDAVSECQEKADMCEQQRVEHDEHFNQQMKEMLECMKAYHGKTPAEDPDWWRTEGLRKKVEGLDKELVDVKERLEQVKSEKAIAYEYVERLVDEKKELAADNERLQQGASPSSPPLFSSNAHRETKIMPDRYPMWPDPVKAKERRVKAMEMYREKQRLAIKKREKTQELLENARRWNLGPHYPPLSRTWSNRLEETSWERWEGEKYLKEVVRPQEAKGK